MSKFFNKKEQVYDLRLSAYGHYLLSTGKLKPTYYAFFDDNILYDPQYASGSEAQSDTDARIRDTQYLESQVLFEDIEEAQERFSGEILDQFTDESSTPERNPRLDVYRFDKMIGDAELDGNKDIAPAWKVAALQNMINSAEPNDKTNRTSIPQLDIVANYKKTIVEYQPVVDPDSPRALSAGTGRFVDGKTIQLQSDDPLYYIEELNTLLLTENFDLEVFLVSDSDDPSVEPRLERKFFRRTIPQIKDGLIVSNREMTVPISELTTSSVEYYFDVLMDVQVNHDLACRGALEFNKESYYVDIDFDCDKPVDEATYYDIYGSVTEPEICQD